MWDWFGLFWRNCQDMHSFRCTVISINVLVHSIHGQMMG